jgi:hypothetical protein
MLVHVTPRIRNPYSDIEVSLLNIEIPEINRVLHDGVDLTIGKPYPNKTLIVVRQKKGRKAINGIFLNIPDNLNKFTMRTHWRLDEKRIITHTVNYRILDRNNDFSSDDPVLWYATGDKKHKSAFPDDNITPCHFHAHMTVAFRNKDTSREGDVTDQYKGDWLLKRTENYPLPSLPRDRIFCEYNMHLDRMPQPEDAFGVNP